MYNFNKKIKSVDGELVGIKIIKRMDDIAAIGMESAHAVLGHQSHLIISSAATRYEVYVCK